MKKVSVKTASKNYQVLIGENLLEKSGAMIKEIITAQKALVVCDQNTSCLYRKTVETSLKENGFLVSSFTFEPGEKSKTPKTALEIVEVLSQQDFSRSDIVVAVGGGITGDISAFSASIYQRGIRVIAIPTSLLAIVDSSVGGKTGVNLEKGKNLMGTFFQPDLVICDTNCLASLPNENYLDGIAEIVKTAVLFDSDMFKLLETKQFDIKEIIEMSVRYKAKVVEQDETEKGERKKLNLGHTIGHAIEKLTDYTVSHGKAVAIGLAVVANFAERSGISEQGCADKITKLLESFGLSVDCEYSAKSLAECAMSDKKRDGGEISLVLPKRIGECVIKNYPTTKLQEIIELGTGYGR